MTPDPIGSPADPGAVTASRLRVVRVDRGAVRAVDPTAPSSSSDLRTVPTRPDGTLAVTVGEPVPPAVGDWLLLAADHGHDDGARPLLLPRTSELVRDSAGREAREQVLAANVDVVLIAEHLDPAPSLGRVERLLTLTYRTGASAVVVLTKADLAHDPAGWVEDVRAVAPGVSVHAVSAVTGQGLGDLEAALPEDATLVIVGPSGAGKSTLVNALAGTDVMGTGPRRRDGRGRHTTTHRELVVLPRGRSLIDTPGLRAVGLVATPEALEAAFDDVATFAAACRFADCSHVAEPGCAVLAALAEGALSERRLASWRSLAREARRQAARSDARLAAEDRAVWKRRTREMRGYHRIRP